MADWHDEPHLFANPTTGELVTISPSSTWVGGPGEGFQGVDSLTAMGGIALADLAVAGGNGDEALALDWRDGLDHETRRMWPWLDGRARVLLAAMAMRLVRARRAW